MIRLHYNTTIIDDIRHVHFLYFSLCLVEGTHREHVKLVEVDAPDVVNVDGTLGMLNMSRIHNSKSVRGRWLLLTGGVSSDKSAMALEDISMTAVEAQCPTLNDYVYFEW